MLIEHVYSGESAWKAVTALFFTNGVFHQMTAMKQGIIKHDKAETSFVIDFDVILACGRSVSQEYTCEACGFVVSNLDTIWHKSRKRQETR
jgi:hypothetical protein